MKCYLAMRLRTQEKSPINAPNVLLGVWFYLFNGTDAWNS